MKWFLIVLIIVFYLIGIGAICALIDEKEIDEVTAAFMAIIWPIVLPVFLGYRLVDIIRNKKKRNKKK